jgi:HPt (histidine-containing phosphotransfer) domain-containing protein
LGCSVNDAGRFRRKNARMTTRKSDGDLPPLDLERLREQSGGDAALEREVLALFAAGAAADLARLQAAETPAARSSLAHRMAGSARAVGADTVARLAREIEAGRGNVSELARAVAVAREFIERRLAAGQ